MTTTITTMVTTTVLSIIMIVMMAKTLLTVTTMALELFVMADQIVMMIIALIMTSEIFKPFSPAAIIFDAASWAVALDNIVEFMLKHSRAEAQSDTDSNEDNEAPATSNAEPPTVIDSGVPRITDSNKDNALSSTASSLTARSSPYIEI